MYCKFKNRRRGITAYSSGIYEGKILNNKINSAIELVLRWRNEKEFEIDISSPLPYTLHAH